MSAASCGDCGRSLTKNEARPVYAGRYVCGDCAYRREQEDAKRQAWSQPVNLATARKARR